MGDVAIDDNSKELQLEGENSSSAEPVPDEVDPIVHQFYLNHGGPSSFSGIQKLHAVLKRAGYRYTPRQIQKSLRKLTSTYAVHEKRYKNALPSHIPKRFSYSSAPLAWVGADTAFSKRWRGVHQNFQIYIDHFSRFCWARAIVKVNAQTSVKTLESIFREDMNVDPHQTKFPVIRTLFTDRGW